ncbi:MAG: redox-regulated ATPase YchF [Bacteroidetes bacterium]|nr:MAG: redox-regulated ATPase YchF [Bacteroidota bacterium]
MGLKCGIIGITNIGKTTIFNCISNTKAEASNFAFSASKSNIGMITVPDDRLDQINSIIQSDKVTAATVDIVDIPGLTKGSSKGEGIGNKFLNDIQQCDALIHVVRCFDDDQLPHIEGSVNPVRDKEIVDLELQIKDLEMVDRRIERTEKIARSGDKEAKRSLEILKVYKDHLEDFKPARTAPLNEDEKNYIDDLLLLSDKPVIYVCNVDDASAVNGNAYADAFKESVAGEGAEVLIIAGELESEITELEDEEDRQVFLEDAGLKEPGVNKMIRSAYDQLQLQSFFTAGKQEVRAWTIRKGMTAPQAAGTIHSDLERGFIRAEVMSFDDFHTLGSEQAVKDAGKFRVEGKTYVVQEGDLLHIRFNV